MDRHAGQLRFRTSGIRSARRWATSAQTLPAGVVGPFFNDEFGDTYGIIYAFTADGFTHRELRDQVEARRARDCCASRTCPRSISRGAGREDLRGVLDASSSPGSASIACDLSRRCRRRMPSPRPACADRGREDPRPGRRSVPSEEDLRKVNFVAEWPHLPAERHRHRRRGYADPPQPMFRVNGAACHRARHLHAARRRHSGAWRDIADGDGRDHRRPAGWDRAALVADQPRGCSMSGRRVHQGAVGGDRHRARRQLPQPGAACGRGRGSVRFRWFSLPFSSRWTLLAIDLQRVSLGALIIALGAAGRRCDDHRRNDGDEAGTGLDDKVKRPHSPIRSTAFPMLTGTLVTIGRIRSGRLRPQRRRRIHVLHVCWWFRSRSSFPGWSRCSFAPLIGVGILSDQENAHCRGAESVLSHVPARADWRDRASAG